MGMEVRFVNVAQIQLAKLQKPVLLLMKYFLIGIAEDNEIRFVNVVVMKSAIQEKFVIILLIQHYLIGVFDHFYGRIKCKCGENARCNTGQTCKTIMY